MILKKNNRALYGLSYQGSKTKLMPLISRMFPPAEHFYDLFGGGFSITHYMAEHRSKSFKQFHYNEIRPGMCELIQDAIAGKYNYDVFKPEWISRERFFAEKESNPYIKIIWSFGNNGKSYIFGEHIAQEKRSMHMAVVFDEFDDFFKETFKLDRWPNQLSITGKRLLLKVIRRKLLGQRLELDRLQQLQQLEQKIVFTNKDYREVEIKPNSVIYCDIPYKGTTEYDEEFSHKEFFDWADKQIQPVFISEYNIDDSRFYLLKEIVHRTTFSANANKPVAEKLYGNKAAYQIIKSFKK